MLDIKNLFLKAYKEKSPELGILSEIKSRIQLYNTSKEAVKTPYNEVVEVNILKKLKAEHEETLSFMKSDDENRGAEIIAIRFLENNLPAEASEEEIEEYAKTIVTPGDKKGMGNYIKAIKAQFPSTNGALISQIVKRLIE